MSTLHSAEIANARETCQQGGASRAVPTHVIKRDGTLAAFDRTKIRRAMELANRSVPSEYVSEEMLDQMTDQVVSSFSSDTPSVEEIQDIVEYTLFSERLFRTTKAFIIYREAHTRRRDSADDLMKLFQDMTFANAHDVDMKRENANIDADTAMGTMLKYGSEGSKYFIDHYILPEEMAQAHSNGDIHIHDKDFYMLTETCCQLDLHKLFHNGFSTGHGYLREPKSIISYAALACIALQANQNEMHGGQSIPDFDFAMAPGVIKTFRKKVLNILQGWADLSGEHLDADKTAEVVNKLDKLEDMPAMRDNLAQLLSGDFTVDLSRALELALERTRDDTNQAMQALVHNLNTMNSRAGAQVPFSSLNYGTDT
ncbi:MAG TPA: anaerobic ribonucleoside-triphosphate reductase, partial [Bacillota bacterium]|nr:anaerobic ribonucleoside-triphosphate reductase [Bacillota bacterium]